MTDDFMKSSNLLSLLDVQFWLCSYEPLALMCREQRRQLDAIYAILLKVGQNPLAQAVSTGATQSARDTVTATMNPIHPLVASLRPRILWAALSNTAPKHCVEN